MNVMSTSASGWLVFLGLVALGGCGDAGDSSSDDGSGASGSGGQGIVGGAGGAGATGTGTGTGFGGEGPCLGVTVGTVSGQVLDDTGVPPDVSVITVCANACITSALGADGTFTVDAGGFCFTESSVYDVPKFIYHGTPGYADVTVEFVPPGATDLPETVLPGIVYTTSLADAAKAPLDESKAQTFDDGAGFTLSVQAGALTPPFGEDEISIKPGSLELFPLPSVDEGLTALYFIGPDNTYVDPPALVRFPNTEALPAGTPVDLLAIGNMGTTGIIIAGQVGVVGTGRVTVDGQHVESDPAIDSGLITLGWVGYRPQ